MLTLLFVTLTSSALFAHSANAETHTVELFDFVYAPRDIVINEGDTVLWVGVNDFHNVVSGTVNNEDGIFRSDIVNRGNTFSFTFYREILNGNPSYNGHFPYFCEPHVDHGMIGSVTVQRVAKNLHAAPSPWEMLYSVPKTVGIPCALEINASESLLTVQCSEFGVSPASVSIHEGALGQKGAQICSLGSSLSGTCAINQGLADLLLSGQTFIEIGATNGIIHRGQITKNGGNSEVSGVVRVVGGFPLSGAAVTDGTRSTVTRSDGGFVLGGVTNGVYELQASKVGYIILPDIGINPFLVNGGAVTNRNFTAAADTTHHKTRGDIDGDGVFDPSVVIKDKFTYLSSVSKNKRTIKLKGEGSILITRDAEGVLSLFQSSDAKAKRVWNVYDGLGKKIATKRFGRASAKIVGGCDLNGDGATDITVHENRIIRSSPDGGVTTTILPLPFKASLVSCQDLDSDGISEFVVSEKNKKGVLVHLLTSSMQLLSSTQIDGGSTGFITEMNHDGTIDYGALGVQKERSVLLVGNGRYQFGKSRYIAATPQFTQSGTNGVILKDHKGSLWRYHIHMKKPERIKLPSAPVTDVYY